MSIVLITVSGEDKPGLTSSLTDLMAQHEVSILDIGQAVIHDALSLGMLLEVPEPRRAGLMPALLAKGEELKVTIRSSEVTEEHYERWVREQEKQRHVVTLLGPVISAEHLSRVSATIAAHGFNIDRIDRLSERRSLRSPMLDQQTIARTCMEFIISGHTADLSGFHAGLLKITQSFDVDIAFQPDNAFRRNRRLVAFDMDSTLIQVEVIDELARLAGVGEQVAQITASAMRGELDFKQSFRKRVALLKGLEETRMHDLIQHIPLTQGAERLVTTLRALGYKTAILSGGFLFVGRWLQQKLGIDYVYANDMEIKDGFATGEVSGEIVDGQAKASLLKQIAARELIRMEQVIAVGDGANDLPMLNVAGLGIAFHAKPIVKAGAKHAISTIGLDGILYLLGMRDRET